MGMPGLRPAHSGGLHRPGRRRADGRVRGANGLPASRMSARIRMARLSARGVERGADALTLVKDLTKQVMGKRIRIKSDRAQIESTVRGISFGDKYTTLSLEAPTSRTNFVLNVTDGDEVEVVDED